MKTKKYEVVLGIDFVDTGKRIQTTCLLRDGKTVGIRNYVNSVCNDHFTIDGLDREWLVYFVNESKDILALAGKDIEQA